MYLRERQGKNNTQTPTCTARASTCMREVYGLGSGGGGGANVGYNIGPRSYYSIFLFGFYIYIYKPNNLRAAAAGN